MNKWLVIVVILVAGGYWYKSNQQQAAEQAAIKAQAEQANRSRVPTEAQCHEVGGRIIEGMGCVVGAPESPANPNVPPEEMASVCQSLNQKYVREINACVSG